MARAAVLPLPEIDLPSAAMWRRIAGGFGALVLAAYALIVCALAVVQPDFGWDMLAYAAAVFEWNGATPEAAHAAAYAAVEANTSPAQFTALQSGDAYRVAQAESWQAFHSVQPLYTAKLAYIALLAALDPLVGGPVRAAWLVNWVSVAAFVALIGWWLHRHCLWLTAPLVAAALMALNFADTVNSPMPDLAAAALVLAGSY
ncbi:MAG: hypothetical protein AAFO70_06625, partial [Pseudomonadota bacterium]